MEKEARQARKKVARRKPDDPLKQYVILDAATMKTPPGRFVFVPVDTEDVTNRMCWAIGLSAYADALKLFGRKKHAMSIIVLAAEMATDIKLKHPEMFRQEEVRNGDEHRKA